jgi:hypothetical protein
VRATVRHSLAAEPGWSSAREARRTTASLQQLPPPLAEGLGKVIAAKGSEAGSLGVNVVEVQWNHPGLEKR